MDTTNLIAWLPFDDSTTQDLCGNTWTATGNPTIGTNGAISGNALQLNGSSYLQKSGGLTLGGQDFTICGLAKMDSSTAQQWGGLFALNGNKLRIIRYNALNNAFERGYKGYLTRLNISPDLTTRFHFELDYQHSTGKWFTFFNGNLIETFTSSLARTTYSNVYVGQNGDNRSDEGCWGGSIDEFQIYDGVALHTANFTPPTAEDYFEQRLALTGSGNISLTFDVARRLSNRVAFSVDVARVITNSRFISVNQSFDVARKIVKSVSFTADVARIVQKIWRYINLGTADDLITSGTTLTNRTKAQSITGTAFYQTTRAKCFDLPTTPEIWIKFDVYFDGSNRWRAYNAPSGSGGLFNGISAQQTSTSTGILSFFAETNQSIYQAENATKKNQLQTVLLHMISGSSAGIVEAWVDGDFIYRYTGNVNNGQDFADIYLQSDGSGTFFSNVIISNAEIGLTDGYKNISFDVARRLKNRVIFTADVARRLTNPIVVPFIGEHFNHFVKSVTLYRGVAQKIILPKKSKVYVRAGDEGIVRIFSDTDNGGVTTSGVYAELDESNSVFLELIAPITPQQILRLFMKYLNENYIGGAAWINSALPYCTNGKVDTMSALAQQFLDDLNASASYSDFLRDYCDIILDNADTGAISGSDAGGGTVKTAESVVPENIPVENWVVPDVGSVVTIDGLSVHFPTTGASGVLSDVEKHILAGLNSVWVAQSLKLIDDSFGLNFNNEDVILKDIDVTFIDDSTNTAVASVAVSLFNGDADSLELIINMAYCQYIDLTSADGLITSLGVYLDRILAHEFTHAVMAANISEYGLIPAYLREGAAELVHGIDDLRRDDIVALLTTDKEAIERHVRGDTVSGDNAYTFGYMFLRYFAKQATRYYPLPDTFQINNLLISDGATDSGYNALTDNTRQIFSVDVTRTLVQRLSFTFDVAIQSVIRVSFTADVARAVLAELILFPIDNTPLLQSKALPRLRASKQNTQGLQSFEVTIGEQQITEQLKFAGIIPFDILQQVSGQYLDYHFNMRVERIQQEGIIYRCECCSDLDKLLFTQLAYTIPPSTWHKVGADDTTVEIETHYPPATAHVQKIAAALGLTPVMQFDNFLSTVLMDDLGGVTYNDLIRDVFGWSSRVPHRLINCYIRDGKLFVIQRGHEAHTVDISNAKCSMPVITKELIRTTWGSTPWSKTQTTEFKHTRLQVPDDVVVGSVNKPEMPDWGDYPEFSPLPELPELPVIPNRRNYISQSSEIDEDENTTSDFEYDEDNLLKRSETRTEGKDGVSKTITHYYYKELRSGRKILVKEITEKYSGDVWATLEFDERITVNHTPLMQGQEHVSKSNEDGEIGGTTAGQTASDYRVTPFMEQKWLEDWQAYQKNSIETRLERANTILDWCKKNRETAWNLDEDRWERFNNYHEAMQKYTKALSDQRVTDTETWELTTNGLSLYDSSFPIHDEATLIKVTNDLKWLNRRTQETLTLSLYEFPHLIDFNDRVVFNGKTYSLVNNTATTTPRIFNEQNLTLARWY